MTPPQGRLAVLLRQRQVPKLEELLPQLAAGQPGGGGGQGAVGRRFERAWRRQRQQGRDEHPGRAVLLQAVFLLAPQVQMGPGEFHVQTP